MSQLMRLWHFSSSVNSFFKRACAAIQWGLDVWFWSDPSSTSIIRDFNGHLPYLFQNPISNCYLSLEAGKSVILRKLTNVEIIFRALIKSLKKDQIVFWWLKWFCIPTWWSFISLLCPFVLYKNGQCRLSRIRRLFFCFFAKYLEK